MRIAKKALAFLLCLSLLACGSGAAALPSPQLEEALGRAKAYLWKLEKEKGVLSPWSYIALAASGESLPAGSASKLQAFLEGDGALAAGETNAWSLRVLALLAAGEDTSSPKVKEAVEVLRRAQLPSGKFPDNVKEGGEDLVNSHIWAVLALKAAGASIPDPDGARRWLLAQQHEDGSFYWNARDRKTSDVDSTGMALMALKALGEPENSPAVQRAVSWLQKVQKASGGFEAWGAENAESCAMAVLGLLAAGVDARGPAFQKPGGDPVAALLRFQLPDGSFTHVAGGGSNEMATYHGVLALSSLLSGENFWEKLGDKGKRAVPGEGLLVRFGIGKKWYVVEGGGRREVHAVDVAPFIRDGRVFVPVRYLARALGVPEEGITWDARARSVRLTKGDVVVRLTVGEKLLYRNGAARPLDVAPVLVSNRVWLPARAVAEAFGWTASWDEARQEVLLAPQGGAA